MDDTITVETDLFEHREVKPYFINPCCFGEDFAAWLKEQLADLTISGYQFSEIIQEDYGWGFFATHNKDRFWIALSFVGNGPQEETAQWTILVNRNDRFNLIKRLFHKTDRAALQILRDRIRHAVVSNNGIKIKTMT